MRKRKRCWSNAPGLRPSLDNARLFDKDTDGEGECTERRQQAVSGLRGGWCFLGVTVPISDEGCKAICRGLGIQKERYQGDEGGLP